MELEVFSVPIFLVVFRETLETAIIVSVLLAFLKQTLEGPAYDPKLYKTLRKQVWLGTGLGLLICAVIAAAIIAVFYAVGHDAWQDKEYYWEGAFSLIGALIIGIMGAALLRTSRLQDKWRLKLLQALEADSSARTRRGWLKNVLERYSMFILPFVTVLREGIEATVFVAGVSFSAPPTAIPLPTVLGALLGATVGYGIYRGGSAAHIQVFLVVSTCFLYLVGAGLFSRAVWYFEQQQWNDAVGGDAAEVGSGPGSYDIDRSVWHVNCCSPVFNGGGGWGILQAIFGWTNSATYGSVISYNLYWLAVIVGLLLLKFKEEHGHYPFLKGKADDKKSIEPFNASIITASRESHESRSDPEERPLLRSAPSD
ncbi:iron permease FTR1 [Sarocladium strictum]